MVSAAAHQKAVQAADGVELRRTGGRRGSRCIDETADAGVGDDDLGPLPRHFDVAVQLARAAAIHFVQDHACEPD